MADGAVDALGRPELGAGLRAQVDAALAAIPDGRRAALVVIGRATDTGGSATAHLAARFGDHWKVAAGGGVTVDAHAHAGGGRLVGYGGFVAVAGSW
jgi:hypothetical protein